MQTKRLASKPAPTAPPSPPRVAASGRGRGRGETEGCRSGPPSLRCAPVSRTGVGYASAPPFDARNPQKSPATRLPHSQTQRGPGSSLGAGRTSGAPSGPRALTEPKGLRARESWGYEAIVHPLPKTATRQALCPREWKVTSFGRRQQGQGRWAGTGIPAFPREMGVQEAPGSLPEVGSIPSARSPASRRALGP